MNNFQSEQEYLEWCKSCVEEIHMASICIDNDKIRKVVHEIAVKCHVVEGDDLIGDGSTLEDES